MQKRSIKPHSSEGSYTDQEKLVETVLHLVVDHLFPPSSLIEDFRTAARRLDGEFPSRLSHVELIATPKIAQVQMLTESPWLSAAVDLHCSFWQDWIHHWRRKLHMHAPRANLS